jgi:hypothetical protein
MLRHLPVHRLPFCDNACQRLTPAVKSLNKELGCLQLIVSTRSALFLECLFRPDALDMNEQRILEELLTLLEANGVTIRREALAGGVGGLCTVKGQHIFFVDTQSGSADVAALAAEAVCKIVDIEAVYVRPEIRQFIEI